MDSQQAGETPTEKLDTDTTDADAAAAADPKHVCEIYVTFPTDLQAEQALQILQVDREPTDRVSKAFALVKEESNESNGSICKLRM